MSFEGLSLNGQLSVRIVPHEQVVDPVAVVKQYYRYLKQDGAVSVETLTARGWKPAAAAEWIRQAVRYGAVET